MPRHATTNALLVLSLLGCASATCQAKGQLNPSSPGSPPQLCQPTGEGTYTFSMQVTEVEFPTFDPAHPNAGYEQDTIFVIYDNACKAVASYSASSCGTPFIIEENFLPYVLTVKSVWESTSDAYFEFAYANGLYSINNNHCGCQDMSHGLTAVEGCKCAFPLKGQPTKREIEFEA